MNVLPSLLNYGEPCSAQPIPVNLCNCTSNVICNTTPCPVILNATCVFYEGPNLIYSGVNTNDNLQTVLEKLDALFEEGNPAALTLTTNGTTGPATYNNNILNIPQYQAGVNIYNSDGTLTSNRTVTNAGYSLTFNGGLYVKHSMQSVQFSAYYGANSVGENIFVGGGGNSSVGAVGETYKGSYNASFGSGSLLDNTTGYYNTAFGFNSLSFNTTGYFNNAVGVDALRFNTSGYNNIAVGTDAISSNTTGFNNSAIGVEAGKFISSGGGNQTSDNSIYIGYRTRANVDGGTNEIVIGSQTTGNGSNTVTLGNNFITNTYLKGVLNVATINAATTDTDKFLVSDGGAVKFRTGTEVLSDIGGVSSNIYTANGTLTGARTVSLAGNNLDFSGGASVAFVSISSNSDSFLQFANSSSNKWRIGNAYGAGANYLQIYDNVTSYQRLRWDAGGSARFDGDFTFVASTTNNVATFKATEPNVTIESAGVSNPITLTLKPSTNYQSIIQTGNTGGFMQFKVANVITLQLSNSNNVLIGTSVDSGDKLQVNGAIKTAAPAAGTAKPWKLGNVAVVSPTSPNRTIEVEIDGVTYYLHAKTTND